MSVCTHLYSPSTQHSFRYIIDTQNRFVLVRHLHFLWYFECNYILLPSFLAVCKFLNLFILAKGVLPDDHPLSAASARSLVLGQADVVMLVGARLNWLLNHGKGKKWNPNVKFIQVDISAEEMDSNREIVAPVVGDIASSLDLMLCKMEPFNIHCGEAWMSSIQAVKQANAEKIQKKLTATTQPMNYFNALKVVSDVLQDYKDIYLVNEGANALDNTRNIVNMYHPRLRLDTGTWGVMGIGMGYSIGAAVTG